MRDEAKKILFKVLKALTLNVLTLKMRREDLYGVLHWM